ncbi:hypothetical protein NDI47_27240 [Microcoleus vaginatus GB1-A2]|uniref:hypothetical protein n=1 Tax=Microcoleus vaginatus TaxID=119532 RepID=UPI001689E6CF|nr:hypothetical protein [Microcoleus sp. FACHB-61]
MSAESRTGCERIWAVVVCEVWSPYDAFDAAQTMLRVLKPSKAEDVSPHSLERRLTHI